MSILIVVATEENTGAWVGTSHAFLRYNLLNWKGEAEEIQQDTYGKSLP